MSIRQLIYTSIAIPEFEEWMLEDILEFSLKNNKIHGVTGLLLYHDYQFMQVIEGTKKDIGNLLKNLYLDKRHHHLTVILDHFIENRDFPTWQMGFKKLEEDEKNESTIQFSDYVATKKPSRALFLLKHIFSRY